MSAWIPVEERLPLPSLLVQVRLQGPYDEPCVGVAYVSHGMKFGDGPLPLVWKSAWRDHKGRAEELSCVTHWAPLLGPEL